MTKILVTCEMAQDVGSLRQILSELSDCAQIRYLTDAEAIRECLLGGDIDICFIDYETPNYRLVGILDRIEANEMRTMAIILAEPQNLSAVQSDRRYENYLTLLKPLGRAETLFAVQQTLDDNDIAQTGTYAPSAQALWRRTQPLLARIFWSEALYGHSVTRVRSYGGSQWPSVIQSAIAAGIEGVEKELALPVLISLRLRDDEDGGMFHETGIYRVQTAFESLARSVILRGSGGCALFEGDRSAAVFYPYDIRLPTNQIAHRCYQLCRELRRQFGWACTIVIGRPRQAHELTDEWLLMRDEARKRQFRDQAVYVMGADEVRRPMMSYAPVTEWGKLILDGRGDRLEQEARAFFRDNEDSPDLTTDYVVNLIYELDRFVTIAMAQLDYRSADPRLLQQLRQQLTAAHRSPDELVQWLRMMADYCTECRRATRQSGSVLEQAEAYIAGNLDGDLSRQTIADHAHVSANYLARLFREQKQTTIADYILRARLERACGYLAGSAMTITEIALRVGFSSSTYFSSCFKKCVGKTPQQYRAEKREQESAG